jgi:beta-lactamase class A
VTPVSRRHALIGLSLASFAPALARAAILSVPDQLRDLEAAAGGRLGVAALNLADGEMWRYRADERFAMCSTFKFLAAAFVLARVDRGQESLARRIAYERHELLDYSPATRPNAGPSGMDMASLCEAAVTMSDNTAANLMLASFGGPAGLTQYLRTLGDEVTRLDRLEPELNEATPGDPRDTTSPNAMLGLMQRILTSDVLRPDSRALLINWLKGCKTGDTRLRAGFSEGWIVGDKTGTGYHGSTNDIAIAWVPGHAPILIAAYYTESKSQQATRDYVIAEVARIVSRQVRG